MEISELSKRFVSEVEKLVKAGVVKDYKSIAAAIKLDNTSLSNVIKGRRNIPYEKFVQFAKVYKLQIDPVNDIQVEEPIRFITEKVIKLEAAMEVERSILIDLLAIASKKTTTEISTKVAEALDYQISKRMAELKQR